MGGAAAKEDLCRCSVHVSSFVGMSQATDVSNIYLVPCCLKIKEGEKKTISIAIHVAMQLFQKDKANIACYRALRELGDAEAREEMGVQKHSV